MGIQFPIGSVFVSRREGYDYYDKFAGILTEIKLANPYPFLATFQGSQVGCKKTIHIQNNQFAGCQLDSPFQVRFNGTVIECIDNIEVRNGNFKSCVAGTSFKYYSVLCKKGTVMNPVYAKSNRFNCEAEKEFEYSGVKCAGNISFYDDGKVAECHG